jgi:DNA-binding NarL/FixJ family response regulator
MRMANPGSAIIPILVKGKGMTVIDHRKIKILLFALDDVLRDGLQVLLAAVFPRGEIHLTDNELDALSAIAQNAYHLVLFYPGSPFEEQLCAAHKVKLVCADLPVVLVVETQAQKHEALDAGVDRVLFKGFSMETLTSSIQDLVPPDLDTPAETG